MMVFKSEPGCDRQVKDFSSVGSLQGSKFAREHTWKHIVKSEKCDEDILNGREKSYQLVTVCCKYFIDKVQPTGQGCKKSD